VSFWDGKKVLVTGGAGFIGSHVVENLVQKRNVAGQDIVVPRSQDCDLRVFENCLRVVEGVNVVIHGATTVGGIKYNNENLATQFYNPNLINSQIVEAARLEGVEKFVSVCCVCAYPKDGPFPLAEDSLFCGRPEETHLGYGFAKRMMVPQAEVYHKQHGMNIVVVIPFNSYGPRDNFDRQTAHIIPALIRKCFEDEELVVWGDGSPVRDFLYVEDLAEGVILAAELLNTHEPVNLGTGTETSVGQLVDLVVQLTGFKGKVSYDPSMPKGQPRRVASMERAKSLLGFRPHHTIEEGLRKTIDWWRERYS
jgi:GDP-L-fucose synthase